jgi:hypothetical protein
MLRLPLKRTTMIECTCKTCAHKFYITLEKIGPTQASLGFIDKQLHFAFSREPYDDNYKRLENNQ